jgi:hypothetical protein
LSTALPPESGDDPSDVAPSKNSTLPLGLPAPGGFTDTLAVSVTLLPNVDGFGALASDVLVLAGFTVWPCAGDVLPPKLGSPE